jgi:hypothetical protein
VRVDDTQIDPRPCVRTRNDSLDPVGLAHERQPIAILDLEATDA